MRIGYARVSTEDQSLARKADKTSTVVLCENSDGRENDQR